MAFIKNEPLNIKIENAKKELYSRRERQRDLENDKSLRLFGMNIRRFFKEFEFGECRLRPLVGS